MDIGSTLTLRNGVQIPRLGLGVYRTAPGAETRNAVSTALDYGYRHIDTARVYDNESDVGHALRHSGVAREDIFVTTKLWNDDHGRESTLRACDESLRRLGVDYVDLYLVHWPVRDLRNATWDTMLQLLESQKCRAIGVSNYMPRHLAEFSDDATALPAVNQFECSPFLAQAELRDVCRSKEIVVEAYSPLTKGQRLSHPVIRDVAQRHGRTAAQVLIRWALQHDMVVLPKSSKAERIRENAAVFDFTIPDDDMARLDALDENLHTSWDPTDAP